MSELAPIFHDLPLPAAGPHPGAAFNGAPIPNLPHHIGKDQCGRPAVLITAESSGSRLAPILLQNLRVEHGVRCRISQPDGALMDQHFSLIQCQSDDSLLQDCFLELIQALVETLPATPSAEAVSEAIDRMAALFHALEHPPTRTTQGLWGELYLIKRSSDPALMIDTWHNEASERFDFAADLQRLEVKTSGNRIRNHHFSFPQVWPPDGVQAIIASIFVEQSASGRKLGELWDHARSSVSHIPELRLKIDEICLSALGNTWQDARSVAFDHQLAAHSLAFYDVSDIPRVPAPAPLGVTDIRFRSDLALGRTIQEAARATAPLVDLIIGS